MQAENTESETELQAVLTISQVKRQEKPVKQLKVIDNLGDDVSRDKLISCLLYTSPSPRDRQKSRMPSSA